MARYPSIQQITGAVLINRLQYSVLNENLDSIMAGLDVQSNDDVLAVCGSGDAAFAFLEHAASVVAVDRLPVQIEYANKRRWYLATGDTASFLREEDCLVGAMDTEKEDRDAYFLKPGRLDAIRSKLALASFVHADVFDVVEQRKGFTKIYLSNVIDHCYKNKDDVVVKLKKVAAALQHDGLVYACSTHSSLAKQMMGIGPTISLLVDQERTSKAGQVYTGGDRDVWYPVVLRKAA
ncbi:hypothetical protein HYS47_04645 [Candidatus Woesearchaeota archaeon]|nr:hypothetical protein [Candidatus Woesearchaeota archaeon]